MPLLTTPLGPLTCRVFQATDAAPRLAMILCHGFGASGEDLVPLGPDLVHLRPGLEPIRFVFPAAPMSLAGFGYGDARAWWNLDMERMMSLRMAAPDGLDQLTAEVPEGLAKARHALIGVIEEVTRQTGLPMNKVVLGGFSQGAMLVTDVALRLEEAPAALVIFSGTLIAKAEWTARAPIRRGLRVLQSHGRHDPVLPFSAAERLRDVLTGAGLAVDFLPFDGEHTIPLDALHRTGDLLASLVKPDPTKR